ncbi:DUF6463 family protein [Pseudactinotalea sp. Z1748]|uniref:DUF6463 family protein n=1 Tax=Pseudactinotalea sp. Z1748 TaxID=3413027 RepID=UPI003C7B4627
MINTTPHASAPAKHAQPFRPLVGPALIGVCVLHTVVAVTGAGSELTDAARQGWAGAFTGERAVVQWFLMTGLVGLVAGVAITVIERAGPLPWSVSLTLLVVALIGVSMAPTSGFVLVGLVGLLAVIRSASTRRGRGG